MTSDDLRFLRHEFSNGFVFFVHTHTFALCHCCAQGLWSICCAYMCQFHALLGRFCNCNIFFGWCPPPLVSNLVWTRCVVWWGPPLLANLFILVVLHMHHNDQPTSHKKGLSHKASVCYMHGAHTKWVTFFLKPVFMHWRHVYFCWVQHVDCVMFDFDVIFWLCHVGILALFLPFSHCLLQLMKGCRLWSLCVCISFPLVDSVFDLFVVQSCHFMKKCHLMKGAYHERRKRRPSNTESQFFP